MAGGGKRGVASRCERGHAGNPRGRPRRERIISEMLDNMTSQVLQAARGCPKAAPMRVSYRAWAFSTRGDQAFRSMQTDCPSGPSGTMDSEAL